LITASFSRKIRRVFYDKKYIKKEKSKNKSLGGQPSLLVGGSANSSGQIWGGRTPPKAIEMIQLPSLGESAGSRTTLGEFPQLQSSSFFIFLFFLFFLNLIFLFIFYIFIFIFIYIIGDTSLILIGVMWYIDGFY